MGLFYMNNILKIVFVIIGTLIGAGFASGKEIYLFFFSEGMNGILGIIISSLIIGYIVYKSLVLIKKYEISKYKDFLEIFMSKKDKGYFNLKNIFNIIINIFILITFFVMIAGFGAYFSQEIGWNSMIGSIILAIITYIIFNYDIKGVVNVNGIIIPILIVFILIIGGVNLTKISLLNLDRYLIESKGLGYILKAILYSSYNSILLIPVLITLRNLIIDKKQLKKISIIVTIIIISMSLIIFLLLVRVNVDIAELEMPAVYVVSNISKVLEIFYGIIILGSILTTSISLGESFIQNICKNKKSYTQIALIMCITSVFVAKIGFSKLIEIMYPVFGYLGIIQLIGLIFKK